MKIEFEISDKSFEVLKDINEAGMAEFRDNNFYSLEEFKKSSKFVSEGTDMYTENWFKRRNFCDQKDIEDLIAYDLIDIHEDAWHPTYIVTKRGKQILEKYSK